MTILNYYLLSLAGASTITTVVLAAVREKRLDVFFTFYVVEYLVITLLYAYLSPTARKLLAGVAVVLFLGFLSIVLAKAVQVLQVQGPAL